MGARSLFILEVVTERPAGRIDWVTCGESGSSVPSHEAINMTMYDGQRITSFFLGIIEGEVNHAISHT